MNQKTKQKPSKIGFSPAKPNRSLYNTPSKKRLIDPIAQNNGPSIFSETAADNQGLVHDKNIYEKLNVIDDLQERMKKNEEDKSYDRNVSKQMVQGFAWIELVLIISFITTLFLCQKQMIMNRHIEKLQEIIGR